MAKAAAAEKAAKEVAAKAAGPPKKAHFDDGISYSTEVSLLRRLCMPDDQRECTAHAVRTDGLTVSCLAAGESAGPRR